MVDVRLRYLDDAAKSLFISSPAISAHLQTARRSLIDDQNGLSSELSTERICTVCGYMLIPGRTCKAIGITAGRRTRLDRLSRTGSGVNIEKVQCDSCGRVSMIEKPSSNAKQRKPEPEVRSAQRAKQTISEKVEPTSGPPPGLTQHAEEPSRKRPRNKKPTLQSLLSNQQKSIKSNPTGDYGLDLMDLMKQ